MQYIDFSVYYGKAMDVSTVEERIPALRGEITDRNGTVLVTNSLGISAKVGKGISPDDYDKLREIFGFDEEKHIVGTEFIIPDIDSREAAYVLEQEIDNVELIKGYKREYKTSSNMSHILGNIGLISFDEYEDMKDKDYAQTDLTGKSGVEKIAEEELRGSAGKRVRVKGSTVFERRQIDGNNIELTIDKRLQEAVESELERIVEEVETESEIKSGGAVVVIDVNTGEVLAMASYPDYNPGSFAEDYSKNISDESNPLLNRCISGCYEPGSTFKPLVALAALESGVVTADEIIIDEGVYKYYAPTYTPSCYIWNEYGNTHGRMNTESALAVSCNYYFYEVGRRLGITNIKDYAEKFGFGKSCGIELEGEAEGTVASPETKNWVEGDVLQAAIGQSVNMFTPLQMASFTASVANSGKLYKPHIIKRILSYDGEVISESLPETVNVIDIKESHYNTVRNGMRKCITQGTAFNAFKNYSYTAAGKTGTAQVPYGPANGIFIGFTPYEMPEIAISVVIEHGEGDFSSRLASVIMHKYHQLYKKY